MKCSALSVHTKIIFLKRKYVYIHRFIQIKEKNKHIFQMLSLTLCIQTSAFIFFSKTCRSALFLILIGDIINFVPLHCVGYPFFLLHWPYILCCLVLWYSEMYSNHLALGPLNQTPNIWQSLILPKFVDLLTCPLRSLTLIFNYYQSFLFKSCVTHNEILHTQNTKFVYDYFFEKELYMALFDRNIQYVELQEDGARIFFKGDNKFSNFVYKVEGKQCLFLFKIRWGEINTTNTFLFLT